MPVVNGLETEKLMQVVETVKKNWEVGRTVWKASTSWKGAFKVETCSRDFRLLADEPEMLCGTNTAANPVEMVLQAYGACLTIGYAMNAAVRNIKIDDIKIDLEGEIDLPGFLGLCNLRTRSSQTPLGSENSTNGRISIVVSHPIWVGDACSSTAPVSGKASSVIWPPNELITIDVKRRR